MKQYLENRIAELEKKAKNVDEISAFGLGMAMHWLETALEHWNKQLQITDAEEAAKEKYKFYTHGNPAKYLQEGYVAGWQAKTIQLANISEEEIWDMASRNCVENGERTPYIRGAKDMYNKVVKTK